MSHRHISTNHLSVEQKRAILALAKERAYDCWTEILDCAKDMARKPIDMSYEEIMEKFNSRCFFAVIHRCFGSENFLEISFGTFTDPEYFLWLALDVSHIPYFENLINSYKR